MKILILDHYYPAFLASFLKKYPHINSLDYDSQHKLLMEQFFGLGDAYSCNLFKLGHEGKEIVWNFEPLQAQWAKEHLDRSKWKHVELKIKKKHRYGLTIPWISLDNRKRLESILMEQIKEYQPDILYFQDVGKLSSGFLEAVRENAKLMVAQHATSLPSKEDCRYYDLLISSLPNLVSKFRNWGIKCEYLPIGFDDRVTKMIKKNETAFQVTHVGGYGPIHNERNGLLEILAESIPMEFWGYGTEYLKPSSLILRAYRGEAWGLDMYDVRGSSRITLTKHISSVAGQFANNCTLYEATGVGTCLVTDLKLNLSQLFQPEKEVVAYSTPQECVEKVGYLLEHEDERVAIAKAGQKRTLGEHTYYHRMQQLVEILERQLS